MPSIIRPLDHSIGTLHFKNGEVQSILLQDDGIFVSLQMRTTGYKSVNNYPVFSSTADEYKRMTTVISNDCGELVRSSSDSYYVKSVNKTTAKLAVVKDRHVVNQYNMRNVEHVDFDGVYLAVVRKFCTKQGCDVSRGYSLTVDNTTNETQKRVILPRNFPDSRIAGVVLHEHCERTNLVFVVFADGSYYSKVVNCRGNISYTGNMDVHTEISGLYKCDDYIFAVSYKTLLAYRVDDMCLELCHVYDFEASAYFKVQITDNGLLVITDNQVFIVYGSSCRTLLPVGFTNNIVLATVGLCNNKRYVLILNRSENGDKVILMDINYD